MNILSKVEETDKLIGTFMGGKPYTNCARIWFDYFHLTGQPANLALAELLYHHSWDWLMPVVEKIESLNSICLIKNHWCNIKTTDFDSVNIKGFSTLKICDTKIEAVYKAVVEFIKWYNQQNKKQ